MDNLDNSKICFYGNPTPPLAMNAGGKESKSPNILGQYYCCSVSSFFF